MEFNGAEFGQISQSELQNLLKALSAGDYNVAPSTLTQGPALQVESLDSTLKAVTFSEKKLKLWPMIAKAAAYNILEEYNRQTSYGESDNGGFFDANAQVLPEERTSAYNRQVQTVRYIGQVRIVTHPATLVRTAHGSSMMAMEIRSATKDLLGKLERQLFEANAHFQSATGTFTGALTDIPVGSLKFNGLDQQIRVGDSDTSAQYTGWEAYGGVNSAVKDLDGASILEEDLESTAVKVLENHGEPNILFVDPKVASDLNKLYFPKGKVFLPGSAGDIKAGNVLRSFFTSAGEIAVEPSVFLRPKFANITAQGGAPATPTVSGTSTEADTASELPSATFHYRVSAVNNKGESAAAASEDQAVTAGNRVTITIAAGTTGALYYAVYRGDASTGPWYFIGYVKDSSAGGAGGATFRDAGHYNPGLSKGYMLTMDADNIVWRQLCPMLKIDLAILSPAFRFMNVLYGTPIVFRPLYHAIIDNIGKAIP